MGQRGCEIMDMWMELEDAAGLYQPKWFYGIMEMWLGLEDLEDPFQPKWFYGTEGL